MTIKTIMKSGTAAIVLSGILVAPLAAAPARTQTVSNAKPTEKLFVLSIGRGEQVNLPVGVSDVVVANPAVADVDVRSPKQLYILAKGPGETTVYATDAAGRTVYSATVRVGNNLNSVDQMLMVAMPESDIKVTTMNGVVLLTGTVAQPEDVQEAEIAGSGLCRHRNQGGQPHQDRGAAAGELAGSHCRSEQVAVQGSVVQLQLARSRWR